MRTFDETFAGTPDSVADARHWLRRELAAHKVTEERREEAALVLSELATNAVRHSFRPTGCGFYFIILRIGWTMIRIEVTDHGVPPRPLGDRLFLAPPFDGHGYGLLLVEHFSLAWWTSATELQYTVGADVSTVPSRWGGE